MSTESTPSANFRFLRQHGELMLQVAAQAERYVFDDPNVSLIKLRQLLEQSHRQAIGPGRHRADAKLTKDANNGS